MKLHNIISATATQSPTQLDLVIDAEIDGVRAEYPYTYDEADPYGLAPDIAEYLQATPIDVKPYIPQKQPLPELAPYQFRAMLALSGKESGLTAYLDALPLHAQIVAKAKLDYSLSFHRDHDLVEAARQALGLTSAQLDALWMQAASL
jgi:hypothetical protein